MNNKRRISAMILFACLTVVILSSTVFAASNVHSCSAFSFKSSYSTESVSSPYPYAAFRYHGATCSVSSARFNSQPQYWNGIGWSNIGTSIVCYTNISTSVWAGAEQNIITTPTDTHYYLTAYNNYITPTTRASVKFLVDEFQLRSSTSSGW